MAGPFPAEIWNQILRDCTYQIHRNLRCSSKALELLATRYVFKTIYVGIMPTYFKKLRAIAESDRIRQHVKRVVVDTELILDGIPQLYDWRCVAGFDKSTGCFSEALYLASPSPLEVQEARFQIHRGITNEQNAFFDANDLASVRNIQASLQDSFSKLPALRLVKTISPSKTPRRLDEDHGYWSYHTARYQELTCTSEPFCVPSDTHAKLLCLHAVLFHALNSVRRQVQHLEFCNLPWAYFRYHETRVVTYAPKPPRLAKAMQYLRYLKITTEAIDHTMGKLHGVRLLHSEPHSSARFTQFLNKARRLEKLDISYDRRNIYSSWSSLYDSADEIVRAPMEFDRFLMELKLPCLESFKMNGIRASHGHFANWLRIHRKIFA